VAQFYITIHCLSCCIWNTFNNDRQINNNIFPHCCNSPPMGQGTLIIEISRSHSDTPQSVGLLWMGDEPDAETSTWQHTTLTKDWYPTLRRDSNPQSQQTYLCMVQKLNRYTLKVLKCDAGERWIDCARNEVLHRAKEGGSSLHTIKRRKANFIGHILRRNCLLKHVTEGKIQGRVD
jgi:hypothetical protein